MGLLDWIQNIFNTNKKLTANIHTQGLVKIAGEKAPLEIGLFDGKIPLGGRDVKIHINGKDYTRVTDSDGICKLNINLPASEYTALIEFSDDDYAAVKAFTTVIVKAITHVEGTNVNMTYRDGTVYQCAVYAGDKRVAGDVDLTVNGVTYHKTPDSQGLYKLNLNLAPGNYTLNAKFLGDRLHAPSETNNSINITQKVEPKVETKTQTTTTPKVEPQKSRSEKILDEFEKYFGTVKYIDDALAKIQGRGYKFYFSDGYNMYDTIKRIYNRQGGNCYDIAEVLYHLALGMNTKYGRKYEVQYLHVWCPVSEYDHIRIRLRSNGGTWFYRDGAAVLNGESVESNWCGTSNNIIEVNPSFIIDG